MHTFVMFALKVQPCKKVHPSYEPSCRFYVLRKGTNFGIFSLRCIWRVIKHVTTEADQLALD